MLYLFSYRQIHLINHLLRNPVHNNIVIPVHMTLYFLCCFFTISSFCDWALYLGWVLPPSAPVTPNFTMSTSLINLLLHFALSPSLHDRSYLLLQFAIYLVHMYLITIYSCFYKLFHMDTQSLCRFTKYISQFHLKFIMDFTFNVI